jgi:NADP-dependent 3-hydroxy acid dehydrogenase YdfG
MSAPGAVLITGCSTGIGRATAEHLAAKGHTVYATARRPESIADLEAKGIKTLALDVTDETSMQAAVKAVEDAEGAVGALVNNAGYSQSGAVESVKLDDVRAQFETNVFGLIRMSQLVLPGMRRQGRGRIVNVGSMGGTLVFPGGGIYHATKYAVEAISDAMRFEVKGFGVDVVLIQPGLITTEFASAAVGALNTGTTDDGPYGDFNQAVAAGTAGAYEGPTAKLGGPPESVAKVIEKAIASGRPRTRYKVTASARLIMGQRKLLSDRMWDRFVGTQFPRPH